VDDNIVPQPMEWDSQQPSFSAMFEAADKIERLRKEMFNKLRADRDLWKEVAENLATELGKKEYAHAEYDTCKEVAQGVAW